MKRLPPHLQLIFGILGILAGSLLFDLFDLLF